MNSKNSPNAMQGNLVFSDEYEKSWAIIDAAERTIECARQARQELHQILRNTELTKAASRELRDDIARWIESIEKRPLLI